MLPCAQKKRNTTCECFPFLHIYRWALELLYGSLDRFARWIASVDGYAGSDFDYLNDKGIIPASAVLKKGEKKTDAFAEPAEEADDDAQAGGKGKKLEEMEG